MKPGTLYIIATPIGNMEDITLRAIRVLKSVDLVAAEDTRRTGTLLKHYGIDRPLTSLHDHNEREKSGFIISRLLEGSEVAFVSDAGTPGLSDPGHILVRRAIEENIPLTAIPGPCAAITALSLSGLPMHQFTFVGFLPPRSAARRRMLATLKDEKNSMIFYESPRRLPTVLKDIRDILGNRPLSLSRELTKLHEETRRGDISEILENLDTMVLKGEITLVIGGSQDEAPPADHGAILSRYRELTAKESCSTRDAASRIAGETGVPRKEVYTLILEFLARDRSAGNVGKAP